MLLMFNGYTNSHWPYAINPQIEIAIQWGSKWAYIDNTGSNPQYKFGNTFRTIFLDFDTNGEKEFEIPVTAENNGEMRIYIFPNIKGRVEGMLGPSGIRMDDTISGFLFDEINIGYEESQSGLLSESSENNYYRVLGTNFRDDISISADIASDLNNNMSPTLLMNNTTTPASTITMGGEAIKPEIDLLDRLAAYYGAARQRLELEVAHPTAAPLPLLKLNGINDGKVYLPLSESRDWQTNVCKLQCFELPQ
jgi:hypothetical protein